LAARGARRKPADRGVVPADGKNAAMEQRNIAADETVYTDQRRDSNLRHQTICTTCDRRTARRQKLVLSRTAQRDLFALWLLASGAIRPPDRFEKAAKFVAALPGG
jgi:ribosomal protein S14